MSRFFDDVLAPFKGIDIGWEGDPDAPIGDYSVVPDDTSEENTTHDFKITVVKDGSTWDITVATGRVWANAAQPDSAGAAVLTRFASIISEKQFLNVAAGVTKGIWLKSEVGAGNNYQSLFGDVGDAQQEAFGSHVVHDDDTNNTRSAAHQTAIALLTAATAYTFIGNVAITGGGVVTIIQDVKESIDAPCFQYLTDILSNGATNDIFLASDGLFLALVEDDGIDIADDLSGTFTFSNTGVISLTDSDNIEVTGPTGVGVWDVGEQVP